MKKFIVVVALFLLSGLAQAGQGAEYVNGYFELWLQAHKFTDFDKQTDGIHFRKNGAVLDGEIAAVNELKAGKAYSIETRITLRLKDGKRLDDFAAGLGASPEAAVQDALQNFCLTTLHPIYAELFDAADPHVRKDQWTFGQHKRRVFLSEWGQRGQPVGPVDQKNVEALIASALKDANISNDIHFGKLIVASVEGKIGTLVMTIDGQTNEAVTKSLRGYAWPSTSAFYMSKLFFVIGKE